ncbi:MAG TPA: DUF3857 domain-containing protein [Terracidiphilus sp.]|nr:DUF3857 domain-containing protein [Terracidiphilus sp.]
MKTMKRLVVSVVAGVILLGPLAAVAQFREPTKEELQMTADPMAPGADAVYLDREEKTDDSLHYHSLNAEIKILTEKGKQLATVRVPYEHRTFKVRDIEGWTIHPDGTVIKLTAKPSDLMALKVGETQINTMVFTLPSVTVGSILEYRLDIQYDDNMASSPEWDVQQPYFVHSAHYEFIPVQDYMNVTNGRGQVLNRLMYAVRGPSTAHVVQTANGTYSYDIENVPPLPDDDWMPPLNGLRWRVQFYYSAFTSGEEFWKDAGKYWAKISNEFADPSKELREAVKGVVAPGDTEDQKARKIYAAVQALENTDYTHAKSAEELKAERLKPAKDAQDVWTRKAGGSDQLALLFVALARAAGLTAYPMQVVDRDHALMDASYLSPSQLDDYIVIVVVNGKEVPLDPGEKMCPYGLLAWKHALAGGLRETAKGTELALSPSDTYKQNAMERVADLSLEANGKVSGSIRYIMTGQAALHWRQVALQNNPDEVKKEFDEWIQPDLPDGVEAKFDHFLALNDYEDNLMATVNVEGTIGSATGRRVFLPAEFFEAKARHPFVSEAKRTVPIDVHYARSEVETVTYTLPPGFTVESAVPPASLSWPSHALMRAGSKVDGDRLTVARLLMYNYTLLKPDEYADLHDFYQRVAKADSEQIVLDRSTSGAAGN